MWFLGHNKEIITIKGIAVEELSRNSFSELIHEHELRENCSLSGWKRETMNIRRGNCGVE